MHPHLHRADVGQYRLGAAAVAAVTAVLPCRVVLVIAEVIGDLTFQGGLQHPLGQLLQQAALANQLQALAAGLVHEHRDQLLVRDRAIRLGKRFVHRWRLHGGVGHQVSLP